MVFKTPYGSVIQDCVKECMGRGVIGEDCARTIGTVPILGIKSFSLPHPNLFLAQMHNAVFSLTLGSIVHLTK